MLRKLLVFAVTSGMAAKLLKRLMRSGGRRA